MDADTKWIRQKKQPQQVKKERKKRDKKGTERRIALVVGFVKAVCPCFRGLTGCTFCYKG